MSKYFETIRRYFRKGLYTAAHLAVLDAAARYDLEIYGKDGVLQGTHSGYHTVTRHSLVLAKVTDLQQELMDTRTALEQVEREHAALLFESLTGEVLA